MIFELFTPQTPRKYNAMKNRSALFNLAFVLAIVSILTPPHMALAANTFSPQGAKVEDAAHVSGDIGVLMLGVRKDTAASTAGTDGDNTAPIFDASGKLWTNATAAGDTAHDAADGGAPVKVGGKAIDAEATAVGAADRVNFVADLTGKQITLPFSNPENFIHGFANATNTSDTALVAAQSAGVRTYITTLIISNVHASTATAVTIKDGSTGKLTIAVPAASTYTITFPVPLKGTAATAWNFAAAVGVSTVYVTAVGYKGI